MGIQRVCEFSLNGSSDQINSLLAEGYEVADIIPIHQPSGGAMYTRTRGNYVLKILILLSPSDRRTMMEFKSVPLKNGYMSSFNELLASRNRLGFEVKFILPLDVHLDPEAHAGIGKGTYGFGVFFIKDMAGESEELDESNPID